MEYSANPRTAGNNEMQSNKITNKNVFKKNGKKGSPFKMVILAFITAIAVLGLTMLALMTFSGGDATSKLIKKDKYQAVFLSDTSGQVYFGKLKSLNARYYELTDIFYVKVENAVQPDTNNTASQNISLAKLGNELHGPEDVMYISKDKVLFWENLKEDGQVVKAITEFKKNGGSTTNTQNQTQSQNSPTQNNTNTQQNTTNQNNTITR